MSVHKEELTEDPVPYFTRLLFTGVVGLGSIAIIANAYSNSSSMKGIEGSVSERRAPGHITARGLVEITLRREMLSGDFRYIPGSTTSQSSQGDLPSLIVDTVSAQRGNLRISATAWNKDQTPPTFFKGFVHVESTDGNMRITDLFRTELTESFDTLSTNFTMTNGSISATVIPTK